MNLLGLKGMAITGAASLMVGTIGGGWIVHKVWWGKAQASKVSALASQLNTANQSIELSQQSKAEAVYINELLKTTLTTVQGTVTSLAEQNVSLAASRAPRIEKIYREVEKQIDQIQNLDACASAPVDERLLNIVWPRGSTNQTPSLQLAGGVDLTF